MKNSSETKTASPDADLNSQSSDSPARRKNITVGRFFIEVLFSEGGVSLLLILPFVVIYYLMMSL